MKDFSSDKTFQPPDYTLHPKLFSAVKNVENALKILAYENMAFLQSIHHFSSSHHLLSATFKDILEDDERYFIPKTNEQFHQSIRDHLHRLDQRIMKVRNEEFFQEHIKEIYFLLHQAYIELDNTDLISLYKIKVLLEKNEVFEDYLRNQLERSC